MKKIRNSKKKKINPFRLIFLALSCLISFYSLGGACEALGNEAAATNGDFMDLIKSAYNEAKEKGDRTINIEIKETPGIVEEGDIVSVNYSLALENGELLRTNIPYLASNPAKAKAGEYEESSFSGPLEILAGQRDRFPGIHNTVLGMKTGETRRVTISPEDAYGPRNDDKIRTFSSVRILPKETSMPKDKFLEQYKTKPGKGDRVKITPYFYYKVIDVTEDKVFLETDLKEKLTSKDVFGDTRIMPEGDSIFIKLEPKLGADFEVGDDTGKIVAIDEKSFTVDCNHPLAGKILILDTTVVSIMKASKLEALEISWNEDHDEGLRVAKKAGKPVVLILYASWCTYCKKLLDETMKDPRVTMFRDAFVWVKSNSDEDRSLKELYGQDNFPFIVFIDADGKIVKSISGFKYAYEMRDEIKDMLNKMGDTSTAKKDN